MSDLTNLKSKLKSIHNPSLIDKNGEPNGNLIYHIYCDGEITYQKGAWSYLKRKEITYIPSINGLNLELRDLFPINHGKYSYAIVTKNDGMELREKMRSMIENGI